MLVAAAPRDRRACRFRTAGRLAATSANVAGRRYAAGAGRGRCAVVDAAERGRRAPRAVQRLLHRIPADGPPRRRADRRLRDPAVRGRQWFRKVGTRAAQAISKIVMAGVAPRAAGEAIAPRLALGSVAPTVIRARRHRGRARTRRVDRTAQRTLVDELSPIDDIRSTAEMPPTGRREPARPVLAD